MRPIPLSYRTPSCEMRRRAFFPPTLSRICSWFPPVILITNASYTTVQRALKLLDHFADLRSYPSDAGSDLEQLSKRSPVDDLSSREEPRREPLSFGAAVGAVILGLIVTVLLLSFL